MQLLLSYIAQYLPLQQHEEELISQLFKKQLFKKGDFFLEEEKVCTKLGFIGQGIMRYYMTKDGEEKTFAFSRENEFVCFYQSFLSANKSSASIQALEDCIVYVISRDDLQRFYEQVSGADKFGRLSIEQVFVQTIKDLYSLYFDSPIERYQKLVNERGDLLQRIPQYHIASYLGVKPQSLSRIRKRIAAPGIS